MQQAKDTFLITLRDRLAVLNPARVVVVRGALRTAVMADENELAMTQGDPMDCFLLHWLEEQRDTTEPLPLHAMTCEIRYATCGTAEFAGMDRGRVLSAMDVELAKVMLPRSAVKMTYSVTPAVTRATNVFWSEMALGEATAVEDRLTRVVTVTVFALEEAEG